MRPIDADALKMALRLEYPMMPMFKESRKEWEEKTEGYRKLEEIIDEAPTIEPKAKVISQVTFDEDKLREIVHETVERIKEEYDIVMVGGVATITKKSRRGCHCRNHIKKGVSDGD